MILDTSTEYKVFDTFKHLSSTLSFFFNDTATTEIYTLSLHDALPIWSWALRRNRFAVPVPFIVDESSTSNLNPRRSITQLVLKKETPYLNRSAAIYGRTDEQRANQGALAIDVRVDCTDGFTV